MTKFYINQLNGRKRQVPFITWILVVTAAILALAALPGLVLAWLAGWSYVSSLGWSALGVLIILLMNTKYET